MIKDVETESEGHVTPREITMNDLEKSATPNNTSVHVDKEERSILRGALTKSKLEKIQLVNNHAQMVSELEERLRNEMDKNKALEEEMKQNAKKARDREEKLTKKLKIAEDGLAEKAKEVASLQNVIEQVSNESSRQLAALEKVVKTRNEYYKTKLQEQEDKFKAQNESFRSLQKQVAGSDCCESNSIENSFGTTSRSKGIFNCIGFTTIATETSLDLMNNKIYEIKQNKGKKVVPDDTGLPQAPPSLSVGTVSGVPIVPSSEEVTPDMDTDSRA